MNLVRHPHRLAGTLVTTAAAAALAAGVTLAGGGAPASSVTSLTAAHHVRSHPHTVAVAAPRRAVVPTPVPSAPATSTPVAAAAGDERAATSSAAVPASTPSVPSVPAAQTAPSQPSPVSSAGSAATVTMTSANGSGASPTPAASPAPSATATTPPASTTSTSPSPAPSATATTPPTSTASTPPSPASTASATPPIVGIALEWAFTAQSAEIRLSSALASGEAISLLRSTGTPPGISTVRMGGRFVAWRTSQPGTATTFTATANPLWTWPRTLQQARTYRVVVTSASGRVLETSGPLPDGWGETPGVIAPGIGSVATATPLVPTLLSVTVSALPPGNVYLPGYGTAELYRGNVGGLPAGDVAQICSAAWGVVSSTDTEVATGFGCQAMTVGSTGQTLVAHGIASPTQAATYRILINNVTGDVVGESGALPSSWTIPAPVAQGT